MCAGGSRFFVGWGRGVCGLLGKHGFRLAVKIVLSGVCLGNGPNLERFAASAIYAEAGLPQLWEPRESNFKVITM